MKILYITPSITNNFSRVRTLNLIKSFKYLGNDVDVISLYTKKNELKNLHALEDVVNNIKIIKQPKILSYINCAFGLLLPVPLQNSYVCNLYLHLYLLFTQKKKNYDLIYIKRLRMAQYAKYFPKSKVYIDFTDSLTKYYDRVKKVTHGFKKIINIEEYYKHFYYEIKIAKKYQSVICSENDKKYLEQKHNIALNNMKIIYNTLDTKKWYVKNLKKKKEKIKLVFSGIFDYLPNILAAQYIIEKIFPLLPSKFSVTFVGKNVDKSLKSYASDRIIFTGEVTDMKCELEKYDIFICPIQAGSGVKNKILQAGLVGLPIVTNELGIEGIRKGFEKFVFFANTPEEFAEKIIYLSNKNINYRIKEQQQFIMKYYDYRKCTRCLLNEKNYTSLSSNK